MGRLLDLLARPSAWIALVGAGLLCAALVWSLTMRIAPAAAACPPLRASGPSDRMRIIDIGAAELSRHGRICLSIDNVVSAAALGPRQAGLRRAQAEVAAATEALRIAEQPQGRIPIWQSRYGVRPLSPEALAERRAVARARLTTAQRLVASEAAALTKGGDRRLALFLNGERAPAPARAVRGTAGAQTVIFALDDDGSASAAYWRGRLRDRDQAGIVPVTVGIAEEGATRPVATIRATPVRNGGISRPIVLRLFDPRVGWLTAAGLVVLLIGLAGLARSTALLRDGRSRYARYSLGRVQMAWWFAVAIGGFAYIWIVTGQFMGVIGSATLVLLGMAGVTAGASRALDDSRRRTERLSRGFLADLGGVGRMQPHRVQLIVWTVVLGVVLLWRAGMDFTLADLDPNLLSLAALINGIYVALKTQEA